MSARSNRLVATEGTSTRRNRPDFHQVRMLWALVWGSAAGSQFRISQVTPMSPIIGAYSSASRRGLIVQFSGWSS